MVQLQLQAFADAGHRQRLAHLSPDRLHVVDRGAGLGMSRPSGGELGHDRGAVGRPGLDDEAVLDLGQDDVVAAA